MVGLKLRTIKLGRFVLPYVQNIHTEVCPVTKAEVLNEPYLCSVKTVGQGSQLLPFLSF